MADITDFPSFSDLIISKLQPYLKAMKISDELREDIILNVQKSVIECIGSVASVSQSQIELNSKVDDHTNKIFTLETDIAALNITIDTLKASISSLTTQLNDLNT